MARHLSGRFLGKELCQVFGLDPADVYSVQFEASIDDAVFIVVKRFVTEDEAAQIPEILSRYTLVPKDAEE